MTFIPVIKNPCKTAQSWPKPGFTRSVPVARIQMLHCNLRASPVCEELCQPESARRESSYHDFLPRLISEQFPFPLVRFLTRSPLNESL